MQGMSGAAVAGAHLLSLVLMGASRKVFGPEVVAERLVPHTMRVPCSLSLLSACCLRRRSRLPHSRLTARGVNVSRLASYALLPARMLPDLEL